MTKAEQIRELYREGLPVSEIASRLGISYQHAYNTVKKNPLSEANSPHFLQPRPALTDVRLAEAGFVKAGECALDVNDRAVVRGDLPKASGVYAFVSSGRAVYVGVAKTNLRQRVYFYGRPGVGQQTNLRIQAELRTALRNGSAVTLYVAQPPNLSWNGLPVSGCAGLEIGLIATFDLPWNVQGALKVRSLGL